MDDKYNSVLVVEDETSIRQFININLKRSGFNVLEASSGEEAVDIFKKYGPHIIILDIMLPGIDGFEVCRIIREIEPDSIIVMLTARGQDMDKIMGLELGADDYMVKPFNPLELVARIRAILRRNERNRKEVVSSINSGRLTLDLKALKFFKDKKEIELTPTEFSMVKFFMENIGKAISRDELLNEIWGKNYFGDIKTVDVHIRRIREKIEDNPSEPVYIETVWGLGYRWLKEN